MTNPINEIIIFTTSQTPLAVRYPQPTKPKLLVPPLIHRALHNALDNDPAIETLDSSLIIPHTDTLIKHESEKDLELTVKLHLVGKGSPSIRSGWAKSALELLCKSKGLGQIDTVLVGWKGVDYKGKRTERGDENGDIVEIGLEEEILDTWLELQGLEKINKMGTLYLPKGVLCRLVETGKTPKINSLDTPDCHHLPKEYTEFAKANGIELWAGGGGEGSDPLPSAELQNLLQEFSPALGQDLRLVPVKDDRYEDVDLAVETKWVLGYALISKSRNVVVDKGYIISAGL